LCFYNENIFCKAKYGLDKFFLLLLMVMKKLAAAFARAIRESGVERPQLLKKTGIGAPALSRYLNAKATPNPESLARIMSEFPEKHALELFTAYLQEVFPAELCRKIQLTEDSGSDSLSEDSSSYGVGLETHHDELEDSLILLKELAAQREDIRQMLIQLTDVLRGK